VDESCLSELTEGGYYYIDVKGAGDKPKLCEQMFTSLSQARRAVSAYSADNAAEIAKRKMIIEIAARPDKPRKNDAKTSTE
jgi:hypothetical protein